MDNSHTRQRRTRPALRGWCAAGLLVATGAMVKVADAGSISPSSPEIETAFIPISPVRILDTRPAPDGPIGVTAAAKLGPGATLDVAVAGPGLAVPASSTAAMLNITIDHDATHPSYLTVWPTGEPRPLASANNALPNLVASNSMLAKLGNGSISVFNQQGSVNVVIDVVGYLVPTADDEGHVLLVGDGPPLPETGDDGDYYLDATNHELFGPKVNGVWPVGSSLDGAQGPAGLGGILGGMTRFNTAAVNLPIATTTGTAIPFAVAGPVFGTFASPTPPSTTTTTTTGSTGIFEVTYRLDATATGVGTIQVYVNNIAKGPGTNIAAAIATQAFDTVLISANQGDAIQLRFTGTIGLLTTTNTSSLVITQVASS